MNKERKLDDIASLVLECISTAIVVLDEMFNVQYMNVSAENLFRAALNHVKGESFRTLLFVDEEIEETLSHAIQAFQRLSVREATFKLINYKTIHVDYTVRPNKHVDGTVLITLEISQVDRQLRILREEALLSQQKAARILVRSLAHEVKNPLGGLRGAAQLLEQELESDALKEYTGIIIREADRLKNLMNRMLGPNSRPDFKMMNIHSVTEHVRKLILADLPEKIRLRFDYDPSIPEFMGDQDWIVQAVLNITSNAVQAVKDEGSILIKTRALRQYTIGQNLYKLVVCLQIIDDGEGVSSEIEEKIFYPMVTTKDYGTGLGLSIAQSLINDHGGLIEYESRPGKTVFSVLLPIKEGVTDV